MPPLPTTILTSRSATMTTQTPPAPFDGDAAPAPRKRRWLPYAGIAVLVLLIAAGLRPRPLPVETTAAARGPLLVTIDEEGQTRVGNRYVISSPVAGHLRRIQLKPGALVEAGRTVVAVLETAGADLLDARALAQAEARVRGAESAREQAAAQHERAEASLNLARSERERARRLAEQGIISQRDLDVAVTRELTAAQEERAAGFGLSVADYELEQVRAEISWDLRVAADLQTVAAPSEAELQVIRELDPQRLHVRG